MLKNLNSCLVTEKIIFELYCAYERVISWLAKDSSKKGGEDMHSITNSDDVISWTLVHRDQKTFADVTPEDDAVLD